MPSSRWRISARCPARPITTPTASLRARLGLPKLKLMFNVNAEFAYSLDQRPIEHRARGAVFSSLADAILVSSLLTGESLGRSSLAKVREALPDTPLFANTGFTLDNVAEILRLAHGRAIGARPKVGGVTWNPVDGERVKRFMRAVAALR